MVVTHRDPQVYTDPERMVLLRVTADRQRSVPVAGGGGPAAGPGRARGSRKASGGRPFRGRARERPAPGGMDRGGPAASRDTNGLNAIHKLYRVRSRGRRKKLLKRLPKGPLRGSAGGRFRSGDSLDLALYYNR